MTASVARQATGFWTRLRRAFRTRQIYLRSEGRVRYVVLRPATQVLALGALLGIIGWATTATVLYRFHGDGLERRVAVAEAGRQAAERRHAMSETLQAGLSRQLTLARERTAVAMAEQAEWRSRAEALEGRLAAVAAEVDLAEARALTAEAGRVALRRDLAMTEAEALRLVQEAQQLEEMAQAVSNRLAARALPEDSDSLQATLEDRLSAIEQEHDAAATRKAALADRHDALSARIEDLEAELGDAERARAEYAARLASAAGRLEAGTPGGDQLTEARDALLVERHDLAQDLAAAGDALRQSAERVGLLETESDQFVSELRQLSQDRDAAQARERTLREELRVTQVARREADAAAVDMADERSVLAGELARFDTERTALNLRLRQLGITVDRLREALTVQRGEAEAIAGARDALVRERDQLASERDRADTRVQMLADYLAQLAESQTEVVARVSLEMDTQIDEAERTIVLTGLTAEQLLAGWEDGAQGGPFVPYTPEIDLAEHPLTGSLAALNMRIDRWAGLKAVMTRLPFAAPMDTYLITSTFGPRSDPLNSKAARHQGLDLKGPLEAPIYVPAPGRVVFAGTLRGYGRLVDIDHGMGIVTRYAHLASIEVERGQDVGYRDTLGTMGNSGRTTGPHLHYEVLVDGVPVDPLKFIEAGRHVLQQID